jgi:hypothetical protein
MTTWLRIAVIALTIPLAAAAWLFHLFYIGGWCGYLDGGPTGEQVDFCENQSHVPVAIPTAAFLLAGAIAAAASRRRRTALIWWLVGAGAAVAYFVLVPFSLYDKGW